MSLRCEGEVHYNSDEMLHTKTFQNVNGTLCKHDERTRFAYLVVNKEEARKLLGSLKDDKALVNAIKNKYEKTLKIAIESEDKTYVQVNKRVRNISRKQDGKLVHIFNAPAYNVSSKEKALKAKRFQDASLNLEEKEKKSEGKVNITYLHKNRDECHGHIEEENRSFEGNTQGLKQDKKEAYAIISMPYVYNYIYKTQKEEVTEADFKLTLYANEVSVSLMPKLQVEFGIFFDGTNNNMYNIDFFQDFKKYIKKQIDFIREYQEIGLDLKKNKFAREFLEHPTAEKSKTIMEFLRNEIVTDMRYFEPESLKTTQNKYDMHSDSATKDTDKLFNLFVEVHQTHHGVDESVWERFGDYFKNLSGLNTEILDDEEKLDKFIGEYLVKEVLPASASDSSYTNSYTNIKRLYEHYEGADRLSRNDKHEKDLKSFRLYASGSGTIDPVDNKALDTDSIFGLGLGTGEAGVKAHIIYSCEKIAQQLRDEKITHIDELVLDVFGFSRGATQARHFICTMMNDFNLLNQEGYLDYALDTDVKGKNAFSPFYEEENGLYTYINNKPYFNPLCKGVEGAYKAHEQNDQDAQLVENKFHSQVEIDIRSVSFRHANIGDTVTHYGLKQSNDWKDLNINFDENKIGSVFHIMAMDEFRYNFEAYSIFEVEYDGVVNKNTKGNFKEFLVPGAHADVGGGYEESPSEELILYPYGTTDVELKAWNKSYQWIDKDKYTLFEKDYISDKREAGGYSIASSNNDYDVDEDSDDEDAVYMYRKGLSWEYELVCMKLMYDEAICETKQPANRVPLKKIIEQYSLSQFTKNDKSFSGTEHLLVKCYKTLASFEALEKADHQKLRQKYVHQSSNVHTLKNAIANKPSNEGDNTVYGYRVVYGSTGTKFGAKSYS